MKLNLGCGADIRRGWLNLDYKAGPGVDMVWNLNSGKLPFPDQMFDEIAAWRILHHLPNWEPLIFEMFRVLRPGGKVEIIVPYGLRRLRPYYYRFFLPDTIRGVCQMNEGGRTDLAYPGLDTNTEFIIEKCEVHRLFPWTWHLYHYLHLRVPYPFPIGYKNEIVWTLRKPEEI